MNNAAPVDVQLTVYRVAHPKRIEFGWNRYPTGIIGAAVTVGPWCASLRWRRPPEPYRPRRDMRVLSGER